MENKWQEKFFVKKSHKQNRIDEMTTTVMMSTTFTDEKKKKKKSKTNKTTYNDFMEQYVCLYIVNTKNELH